MRSPMVSAVVLVSLWLANCGDRVQVTISDSTASSSATSPGDEIAADWTGFDDALLDLRLQLALLERVGVPALGVEHETSQGTIRLHGRVPSALAAGLVREVVEATPGVGRVESDLEITADPMAAVGPLEEAQQRLADALLAARARAALVRELGRSAFDLVIEAADSHLILRGTVADPRSRDRALAIVATVQGAEQIHDLTTPSG